MLLENISLGAHDLVLKTRKKGKRFAKFNDFNPITSVVTAIESVDQILCDHSNESKTKSKSNTVQSSGRP